jgi:hypothetical protein
MIVIVVVLQVSHMEICINAVWTSALGVIVCSAVEMKLASAIVVRGRLVPV